jgi:anaerobic magnesium-protoporphyrin IX monomethyl ester cyclase
VHIGKQAIRTAVRSAKEAGVRVKTGWVFGLPGSLDEQYESIPFMRELRPHEISIHGLVPFPGTEYYARPAEHGVRIRDPKDFSSFCYGGLGDNVSFDYLSQGRLIELLQHAAAVLESEGYVNSDRATPQSEYVFSTPLDSRSMRVFHADE